MQLKPTRPLPEASPINPAAPVDLAYISQLLGQIEQRQGDTQTSQQGPLRSPAAHAIANLPPPWQQPETSQDCLGGGIHERP